MPPDSAHPVPSTTSEDAAPSRGPIDPADLTARLIRCPSVTPEDGGAIPLLAKTLDSAALAAS